MDSHLHRVRAVSPYDGRGNRKETPTMMAHTLYTGMLGIIFSLFMWGSGMAAVVPKEPGEASLVHEDVNIITGLYIREYSLRGDGVVDFKTARQIVFYENNKYWNTVVETMEWPLFYWLDDDRDGVFDHFVDQRVAGNPEFIIPYLPVSEPEQ